MMTDKELKKMSRGDLLEILLLIVEGAGLVGAGAVLRGVVDALPAGDLLGIFPAAGSGIADALVGDSARNPAGTALDGAAGGIHKIVHWDHPFPVFLYYTTAE